ncbi:MAG: hypothetical protein ACN4GR_06310 [Arenicellales bacterium]
MTDKRSGESRRKLLKSIAAGSGAIVAGKSLPESWSKPVVDSVILPAHAQTSQVTPPSGSYNQTQSVPHSFTVTKILNVDFDVTGFTPTGDGTLTLTLTDDFSFTTEFVTISVDGAVIGTMFQNTGNPTDCSVSGPEGITVPQATLVSAAADGTVTITLEATAAVGICGPAVNQILQLEFPA